MTRRAVDRRALAAELEGARRRLHELVDSCTDDDFDRPSRGTRWTNEQLLFHMVFGFMVVARLLPLVRLFGRLPGGVGRTYARLLNAGTPMFDVINYYGSCAAALVFNRHRVARRCDRVIAKLQYKLANEPEANFTLAMAFPARWDPFFSAVMTVEDAYRYPVRHFDFHELQLTIRE
ncbi:DinB family protein [Nocardia sp. bgisy118]|uniref:DinB family protein n=1 Tax=Nocardia sp. bgisy118 TaxID=3413786 RepID=UPI003F4A1670